MTTQPMLYILSDNFISGAFVNSLFLPLLGIFFGPSLTFLLERKGRDYTWANIWVHIQVLGF